MHHIPQNYTLPATNDPKMISAFSPYHSNPNITTRPSSALSSCNSTTEFLPWFTTPSDAQTAILRSIITTGTGGAMNEVRFLQALQAMQSLRYHEQEAASFAASFAQGINGKAIGSSGLLKVSESFPVQYLGQCELFINTPLSEVRRWISDIGQSFANGTEE
jgi:hypothetical protein